MSPSASILIVEDDPDQSILYAKVLSMGGYPVTTVFDAEQALDKVKKSCFDLLLVDWDLPVMKGDDFITEVKLKYHPAPKTILFSNHNDVDKIAADCDADAWFRKSDDIFRLRKIVEELVN